MSFLHPKIKSEEQQFVPDPPLLPPPPTPPEPLPLPGVGPTFPPVRPPPPPPEDGVFFDKVRSLDKISHLK